MPKSTDVSLKGVSVYLLPISTRVPLKFGKETVTQVTCARARVRVENRDGLSADGWGETPLSVTWVWPSDLSYETRRKSMIRFLRTVSSKWVTNTSVGTALEIGADFLKSELRRTLEEHNATASQEEHMPWLAALVCTSVLDQAIHDAYAKLCKRRTFQTYGPDLANRDLSDFLIPAKNSVIFKGRFLQEFTLPQSRHRLIAWHLVGGVDPVDLDDITGQEPKDGHPSLLRDWIRRDGLKCLKIKLRGNDSHWDYSRILKVGRIANEENVDWLSTDFNCTVEVPSYVNEILDKLLSDAPSIFAKLLYVEQPFPYELKQHPIDVRSVVARKPLFLDESAHDWEHIRIGRELGWSGVALKTCKTQTGALLSAAWAQAHGMTLMVQDLTNPMLAQLAHVQLAANLNTIMGVETNSMQFYPDASVAEARVHPGVFTRKGGALDLSSLQGDGFGYRLNEIERDLPPPDFVIGDN